MINQSTHLRLSYSGQANKPINLLRMKHLTTAFACFVIINLASCSYKTEGPETKNIKFYSYVWDEIINKGNTKLFDSAFTKDVSYDNVTTHLDGLDDFKKYYLPFVTSFSNRDFRVLEIYGQGEKVIKRWAFTGTHTAEFAGIPATNKKITVEGVTIARIVNGKIAEERDYMDDLGFLTQLGVIPPAGK